MTRVLLSNQPLIFLYVCVRPACSKNIAIPPDRSFHLTFRRYSCQTKQLVRMACTTDIIPQGLRFISTLCLRARVNVHVTCTAYIIPQDRGSHQHLSVARLQSNHRGVWGALCTQQPPVHRTGQGFQFPTGFRLHTCGVTRRQIKYSGCPESRAPELRAFGS